MPRSVSGVPLPRRTHRTAVALPATSPAVPLTLRRENSAGRRITLHVAGTIDLDTHNTLRDAAFTAIGAKPSVFCLDIVALQKTPDALALQTLVTISRVAALMRVPCTVLPSHDFAELLRTTGLIRLLPLDESFGECGGDSAPSKPAPETSVAL